MASVSESSVGQNPTGASKQVSEIEEIINRTLEQKLGQSGRGSKVPCLRQYVGEENGQIGRGLVQSLLMFAELAMDVVTGLEAARL